MIPLSPLLTTLLSLIPQVTSTTFFPPLAPLTSSSSSSSYPEFNWTSLLPSRSLTYTPCYTTVGSFECARLLLPLDYLNTTPTTSLKTIALAIIRLPIPPSSPNPSPIPPPTDGGTILFNPGGPGGSGIDFLLKNAQRLRRILDSPSKRFELLSFDPRGMHRSTPTLSCFATAFEREVWSLKDAASGGFEEGGMPALKTYWAETEGLGRLCAERKRVWGEEHGGEGGEEGEGYIGEFMSTPSVATDMLGIVDAVDEHRQKYSLAENHHHQQQGPEQKPLHNPQPSEKKSSSPPLLQYWGLSYGTILGQYFATLYPSRISHMLLDGVASASDFASTGWLTNLQDTESSLSTLFQYCFEGGPRCPLYATADAARGPEAIAQRIGGVLAALREEGPRSVVWRGTTMLVTYTDVKDILFRTLYDPWGDATAANPGYDAFARVVAALLMPDDGPGGPNAAHLADTIGPFLPSLSNNANSTSSSEDKGGQKCGWIPPALPSKLEASPSVFCTDGSPHSGSHNDTFTFFLEKYAALRAQAPSTADSWVRIPTMCHGWRERARWRYEGGFMEREVLEGERGDGEGGLREGVGVLCVGNEADPVTPVRNAREIERMQDGRGGEEQARVRVLLQEGPGHCSLAGRSACTEYVIRRYFDTGEMPGRGMRCRLDCVPWGADWNGECGGMGGGKEGERI
ncbi:MAG: hypothetical protein Q9160_006952 [Pyrenula sp. 1 TL-2023]